LSAFGKVRRSHLKPEEPKKYNRRGSVGKASQKEGRKRQAEKAGEVQLVLDREELVAMMQDSLTSFATEMGLVESLVVARPPKFPPLTD
jgi:hypothetical protein